MAELEFRLPKLAIDGRGNDRGVARYAPVLEAQVIPQVDDIVDAVRSVDPVAVAG